MAHYIGIDIDMCVPDDLDQESALTQNHQWDRLSQGCTRQRERLCEPRNQDLERRLDSRVFD